MNSKKPSNALDRLTDFFVEDILNTSDAELKTEVEAEGNDPQAIADDMRSIYDCAYARVARKKLIAAKAAVEKQKNAPGNAIGVSIKDARKAIVSLFTDRPDLKEKLTLAARSLDELSDRDLEGLIEDLRELGELDENS